MVPPIQRAPEPWAVCLVGVDAIFGGASCTGREGGGDSREGGGSGVAAAAAAKALGD